ncbi:RNA polymerase sigma-70 factor (ECF subfamily) [Sediminitomix flava]|uniref:RNA polymerase sigma factor n=2 Tax=Sediminitomix flava TaxID=379075 RepID=A0A315Z8T9_SEDFL|nr:RNA polymerase sigma-70 factor (ECF subfamily) [Sediminitomix flava]
MSQSPIFYSMQNADEAIIAKFKRPNEKEAAFRLLMENYQERVYFLCRKMVITHEDADDLTQDTFVKAWKSLDRFEGKAKLFTWLYRIAVNVCLDFLEKKKKRFFLPIHDVTAELSLKVEQSADLSGDEIQQQLLKAILTLPEKQRVVFQLKYFEELSYKEMSEVLETSEGALKASYHHAVKKIEKQLKENSIAL